MWPISWTRSDTKTQAIHRRKRARPLFSPRSGKSSRHPVGSIGLADALAFCARATEKTGRRFRLPTEAEWEYACRAGTTTRYHNGDDPDALSEVARVSNPKGLKILPHVQEMEIVEPGPDSFTVPVGRYKPNAWGLFDMHGNAWEWVSDWHGDDYYAKSPTDDPRGPADEDRVRVRRGGGWNSFPLYARASFRNWNAPWSRCVNLGFRVVREVKSSAPDQGAGNNKGG